MNRLLLLAAQLCFCSMQVLRAQPDPPTLAANDNSRQGGRSLAARDLQNCYSAATTRQLANFYKLRAKKQTFIRLEKHLYPLVHIFILLGMSSDSECEDLVTAHSDPEETPTTSANLQPRQLFRDKQADNVDATDLQILILEELKRSNEAIAELSSNVKNMEERLLALEKNQESTNDGNRGIQKGVVSSRTRVSNSLNATLNVSTSMMINFLESPET